MGIAKELRREQIDHLPPFVAAAGGGQGSELAEYF